MYPLGLASIAGSLAGHTVQIYDPNVSQRPFEELSERLAAMAPDVAAVSLRNIDSTNKRVVVFYYKYLKETLDVIKAAAPGAKIAIGGAGFSMYAGEIMENEPRLDFGVYLEGEETFARLLSNMDRPENVPSLYYRKGGSLKFSGPGAAPDINFLPSPAIGPAPVGAYLGVRDSVGVETKRGCALGCVYCIYGFLNGKNYRLKDPVKIVDHIQSLAEKNGVQRFTFVDSVFNIPKEHAMGIMREMVKRGVKVKWSGWFNENGLSSELAETAVAAGCVHFIMSPDGFDDSTLKALGKNISRKDILSAFEALAALEGVEISYNFFKNPPGQSIGNFIAMAKFIVMARKRLGRRVHFEFNSIRVEPHTKLHEIALAEGLVKPGMSLLEPVYYTNRRTWYIEAFFNAALRLKGK